LKRVVAAGRVAVVCVADRPAAECLQRAQGFIRGRRSMEYLKGFELEEFSLIPDNENDGGLIVNATR